MAEQTTSLLAQVSTGGPSARELLAEKNETVAWQLRWNQLTIEQRGEAVADRHIEKILKWLDREHEQNIAALTAKANREQIPDPGLRYLRALQQMELWVLPKKAEVSSAKFRSALRVFAAHQQRRETPASDTLDQIVFDTFLLSTWTKGLLWTLKKTDLLSETHTPNPPVAFPNVVDFLDFSDRTPPTQLDSPQFPIPRVAEATTDNGGKSDDDVSSTAALNAEAVTNDESRKPLQEGQILAYRAWDYARVKTPNQKLTARQVWEFWTDSTRGLAKEDRDDFPELAGYDPGAYSTFAPQLSRAKNHPLIDEVCYGGTKRKDAGSSVVRSKDV